MHHNSAVYIMLKRSRYKSRLEKCFIRNMENRSSYSTLFIHASPKVAQFPRRRKSLCMCDEVLVAEKSCQKYNKLARNSSRFAAIRPMSISIQQYSTTPTQIKFSIIASLHDAKWSQQTQLVTSSLF